MAINPFALAINNPDTVGRAFQGFEQGRAVRAQNVLAQNGLAAVSGDRNALAAVYQGNPEAGFAITQDNRVQARAEDAKRLESLKGLANMGREIMRLPMEARGPAVEQAKTLAARMYGLDPSTLAYVTPDTIDDLTATVETEYDRLAQALGLQSAQLGVQGQILGNQGKALDIENQRGVNAYWQSRLGGGGGGGNAFTAPGGRPVAAPAEYQPMIDAAAARTGLPPALLAAQMNQESRFNPGAVSPAGAGGLMQIMPDTAAQPGYGVQPISDAERFDPGKSVEFGANYMGQLLQEFGGNVEHALAAYNWGPGNAKKWVAAGADPAKLPAETRNYVQTIMSDFRATGAGSGVGVAPGAAPPPAPGAIVTQGTSFNGQRYAPAGPVAGVSPPAGPVAGPTPSAAPAAPQSVVEIAQNDPIVQRYVREAQEAQFAGDTAGASRANAMVEARMKELDAMAPKGPAAPNFNDENALRTQYRQIAQPLTESVGQYEVMNSLSADATGASDVALVFAFFKTIDPTSTVREGEYAAAASAQGLPSQIVTGLQRLETGEKLSPELRRQLVDVAKRYADRASKKLSEVNSQYGRWAGDYGMDPSRILIFPGQTAASGGLPASLLSEADAIVGIGR